MNIKLTTAIAACTLVSIAGGAMGENYPASNVSLHAQLDLTALSAASGNDCWGYVSPSGREYALMGHNNGMTVVEITDPSSPSIVGTVSHTSASSGDIKTYGSYCYVSNGGGGGIDVIDLSNIDAAGNRLTLVQRITTGGLNNCHNIAVNEDSGFLYLVGCNLNNGAVIVYDLSNPAAPVEAGRWTQSSRRYLHDAHIVSYTTGTYAGREILFGFSESRGLDILDVTDKSNIFLISRTPYPNVSYCHQGWTTPDLRYLFVDDEGDELSGLPSTRTLIFDIADLSQPTIAGTFTTGYAATDHNLFIDGCTMYQANYKSGLFVINIADPLNPRVLAHFDTHPESDTPGIDGLWGVYPYLPSGTIIASDTARGLFIFQPQQSADINADGPIDLLDFADLQTCATTLGVCDATLHDSDAPSECATADINFDGEVNAGDMRLLTQQLTGP